MRIKFRLELNKNYAEKFVSSQTKHGVTKFLQQDENGKTLGHILEFDKSYVYSDGPQLDIAKEVERSIKELIRGEKFSNILLVGVGNANFTADCFGVVSSNLISRSLFNYIPSSFGKIKLNYFNPDIRAKTGLDTIKLINLVVEDLKPDLLFLFDCFSTSSKDRIASVIQINNTALSPASAVGGYDKKIKADCQIISIGAVLMKVQRQGFITMSTNADLQTQRMAEIVSLGVKNFLTSL